MSSGGSLAPLEPTPQGVAIYLFMEKVLSCLFIHTATLRDMSNVIHIAGGHDLPVRRLFGCLHAGSARRHHWGYPFRSQLVPLICFAR